MAPGLNVTMLASQYFSRREAEQLLSLPDRQRQQAFLACWTRKEAYLKATGAGLSVPLDSIDVTVLPGDPPRVVSIAGDPAAASRWSLVDLGNDDVAPAVAVEGPRPRLRSRQFPLILA